MARKFKRMLVVSDFHSGHEVGLTPPKWNPMLDDPEWPGYTMAQYRATLYGNFLAMLEPLKPIDICVANGDLIDGRGDRTGGSEVIVMDRILQGKMAAHVLREIGAPKLYITRGTDYHTGTEENWEELVAEELNAERIGDVINLDVNGLMFNFRHHVGGSQTPIGRATPLLREVLWNTLWHDRQDFPQADVIVRSHVHYNAVFGQPGQLVMTTPALQGYGTRYGERRLSGIIDFGLVHFDISEDGEYTWQVHTASFPIPSTSVA